ncbi:MAG: GNAT family N-acetyltransferase [Candidatus Izemoplasmatales bacterium]|jgi:RimJ/RimL family protein N-acetyltransferase|nr:GNAT family N-acetyltransferase [Candidatus Izemoplasmatales bacterium]
MKEIITERLRLRSFNLSDLKDFYEYARLETVGPNAGWTPHPSIEYSKKILESFIISTEVWALELKKENKVIGSIGLHKRTIEEFGEVYELGYVLSTFYEKQGFMTEAIGAVLNYTFNELNLEEIYVGHFLENERSEKLINKFNFKFIKVINYQSRDYGLKVSKIYRLEKKDYINKGEK